jgi:flagellar assembly protein FliH
LPQAEAAQKNSVETRVEIFQYPDSPLPFVPIDLNETLEQTEAEAAPEEAVSSEASLEALRIEYEKRLAEETRRALETGRELGRQSEREAQAQALRTSEEARKRQATEMLTGFAGERDRYLQAVEQEVVKLAMAVAARILRREAQMDPLLLTGAVRVALGQLAETTKVRLRVPAQDLTLWQETIQSLPNLNLRPTVTGDAEMRLGDCAIETELGSVDLGIRAQLAEIERGFFDQAAGMRVEETPDKNAAPASSEETPA